jgi:hypothetical protein
MTIKAFLLGVALAVPTVALADDNACTIATKGDNPIVKACQKGGRKEASAYMKGLVKSAKANGTTFKCDGCHEDLEKYQLKKNAEDDFKKLIEASAKK